MAGKQKNKSVNGGARPGAGRKKGGMNKNTLEKHKTERELRQRIMQNAQRILDKQLHLAEGCSFLFCITTTKQGKKNTEMITDEQTIRDYLDGELDGKENEYYYITSQKPDERALENLLDRGFGKPNQSVDVTSDGQQILGVVTIPTKNGDILEATSKAGESSAV